MNSEEYGELYSMILNLKMMIDRLSERVIKLEKIVKGDKNDDKENEND